MTQFNALIGPNCYHLQRKCWEWTLSGQTSNHRAQLAHNFPGERGLLPVKCNIWQRNCRENSKTQAENLFHNIMAKLLVIHGPNLNLLGTREPEHYGTTTLQDIDSSLAEIAQQAGHSLSSLQSKVTPGHGSSLNGPQSWTLILPKHGTTGPSYITSWSMIIKKHGNVMKRPSPWYPVDHCPWTRWLPA